MNERIQTRLAWLVSATLLAAGWAWRYLPGSSADEAASCAESSPRAVALVVSPAAANASQGERVYVYWLDSERAQGANPVAPGGEGSAPLSTPPSTRGAWKFAGTSVVDETGLPASDLLPVH